MKVLKWVLIVLGILLLVAAAIIFGAWYDSQYPSSITKWVGLNKSRGTADSLNTTTTTSTNTETATTSGVCGASDDYQGWSTYSNNDVGYTLKYPQGWTVKVESGVSEVTSFEYKYITITPADQKYFLSLGLKKKTDMRDFALTDRTGIGAGEDSALAVDKFMMIGDYVVPYRHVYLGKNKEFFFKDETKNSAKFTGDYEASFTPNEAAGDFDVLDMPNTLLNAPIKIMKSVCWL